MNNVHLCDAGDDLFSVWHLHPDVAQCLGYARRNQIDGLVQRHLEMEERHEDVIANRHD